MLAYLTALADDDTERQDAIRRAVADPDEEAALAALTGTTPAVPIAPEPGRNPSRNRSPSRNLNRNRSPRCADPSRVRRRQVQACR